MLRELLARPARTAFTVAGIAIGILALTVVGSLAERLHAIVSHSVALSGQNVFAGIRRSVILADDAKPTVDDAYVKLRRLPGVESVLPEVIVPYSSARQGTRFGPPSLIVAFPESARPLERGLFALGAGRSFLRNERRVALVGPDFAASEGVAIGDVVSLYGNSFTVVGTLSKAFTIFDASVVVPFADGQDLMRQLVPHTRTRLPIDPISAFMVAARPGTDVSLLAQRINTIPALDATDPVQVARTVRSTVGIFDVIVFGAALVALVVGAFSVVNTMTMAVTERTREIGIRKAIGATDEAVLLAFVGESALIGTLGGAIGIGLGLALVAIVDARSAAGGNLELFAVSPTVAAGALGFSVALSIVAGFVPALRAARLPPTVALRQ